MANDGQIVFEVSADGKHAIADIKEITRAIQKETGKWDDAAKESASGIENAFDGVLKKLTAGFSAAKIGKALLDFGMDALNAASDLQEVQNVVDTTFGDNANQIEAWAKNAGKQFGLTETQAKKFTSTMGAMLKSSGLAGDQIVDVSTDLAGLAADMASFYNLDFEEAFSKIRSGISGQTMPLKELGIDLSVDTLNAYALAQGLEKTFNQMSQSEQTMLRYQYLMSATADAQGDFAKTSDTYANAQRRLESAVDDLKAKIGKPFLDVIGKATSSLSDFIGKLTAEPERTILDEFADIDVVTTEKMAKLEATYNKALDIIKVLEEIEQKTITLKDGSTIRLDKLFEDLGNVEKNGGDVRAYLENLGVEVEDIIQQYNIWKENTKQLAATVPSLSSAINSETHAIDGGTEALQKNLKEWKQVQEKKIAWAAYYAKKQALATSEASVWQFRLDMMGAQQAKKRIRQTLEEIGTTFDENGNIDTSAAWWDASKVPEGFDMNSFIDMGAEYEEAVRNETEATDKYTQAIENNATATQELEDIHAGLIEQYGEEEEAAEGAGKAGTEAANTQTDAALKAKDAWKAVSDYVKGVWESTAQGISSTIKGFEGVKRAGDDLRAKSTELAQQEIDTIQKYKSVWDKWGLGRDSMKKMSDNWDKLSSKEQEAYNALVKIYNEQTEVNRAMDQYRPEGMKANLQSQLDFMKEYIDNLEKAKEMGLSNELLAFLSDGSAESAEYLAGLVQHPEGAKEVDELFKQVEENRKQFTDKLTQNKLAVDEVYQEMLAEAQKSVEGMNLAGEAAEASGSTISGIAQGISDHQGEVQTAVDGILAELNRLSGWGVNIDLSPFGSFGIQVQADGSHANGLDYVPFDNYLARLHEGEAVLTAQENKVWQGMKMGDIPGAISASDLETALEGVKAGGNVYLDGRTVGQVVSARQGQQYRQLQRSGWQS